MFSSKHWTLLLITLVNTGCVVGPGYCPPVPPQFSRTYEHKNVSLQTETQPQNYASWWQVFNDGKLVSLIEAANQENLTLQQASWRVHEARCELGVVGKKLLPNGDATAGVLLRKNSPNARAFGSPVNGNVFGLEGVGFDSRWEIDLFGRIQREIESAQANVNVTIEDMNDIRRLLIGDLAISYMRIRMLQKQININIDNQKLQHDLVEKAKARNQAGKVGRLDILQAQVRIQETVTDLPLLQEMLALELNRMNLMLGKGPDPELEVLLGIQELPQPVLVDVGIPAELLRRRPDVRRAEHEIASTCALIGVAESDLYPRLTLLGNIGFDSRNFNNLFDVNSLVMTVGPSVRWNILHFGRIKFNIEAHKARYQQNVLAYQQTVIKAVEEVESSLASYKFTNERIGYLQTWESTAKESLNLALEQYDADVVDLGRVLTAQRRYYEAQSDLVEAQGALLVALVSTYKASGGGWDYCEVHSPTIQQNLEHNSNVPQETTKPIPYDEEVLIPPPPQSTEVVHAPSPDEIQ